MIDIQTFLLAIGIGNVGFAVLLAAYTRGAGARTSLQLWMWARLGLGASQLIGWAGNLLGTPLLRGMEGVGWIVAVSLEIAAYSVFFDVRRWARVVVPVTLLFVLLVIVAAARGTGYAELSALVAMMVAIFAAAMAWMLLRGRRASLLQRVIGANDALFAVAVTVWVTSIKMGWSSIEHGPAREAAYLAGYFLMIVNGFGFLLLCKQKDDQQMSRLASTDSLTGLPNRHAFMERADQAVQYSRRQRQPLSLMMIDIDHFKQINDRWGHASGDDALVVFARTARGVMREYETIGRLGGEEFAMILPGAELEAAIQAAQRLRLAVSDAVVDADGATYSMTVSIGVVAVQSGEDLSAALARADRALYAAKHAGRDRVEAGSMLHQYAA